MSWEREFVALLHEPEERLPTALPMIRVSQGPRTQLIPEQPDEDLGPGWSHSYTIEDGASLIFGDLEGGG